MEWQLCKKINLAGTRELSPVLQKAEITIMDYDECNETLKMKRYRNWGGFLRHQLCAGEKAGGIDTCQVRIMV